MYVSRKFKVLKRKGLMDSPFPKRVRQVLIKAGLIKTNQTIESLLQRNIVLNLDLESLEAFEVLVSTVKQKNNSFIKDRKWRGKENSYVRSSVIVTAKILDIELHGYAMENELGDCHSLHDGMDNFSIRFYISLIDVGSFHVDYLSIRNNQLVLVGIDYEGMCLALGENDGVDELFSDEEVDDEVCDLDDDDDDEDEEEEDAGLDIFVSQLVKVLKFKVI